jgi:hypothetical protein
MIFPTLPLDLLEFEGIYGGNMLQLDVNKMVVIVFLNNQFFFTGAIDHAPDYFAGVYGHRRDRAHLLAGPDQGSPLPTNSDRIQMAEHHVYRKDLREGC